MNLREKIEDILHDRMWISENENGYPRIIGYRETTTNILALFEEEKEKLYTREQVEKLLKDQRELCHDEFINVNIDKTFQTDTWNEPLHDEIREAILNTITPFEENSPSSSKDK